MAVDLAPKEATGAALGVIGISSYMAAGLQDIVSGALIETGKTIVDGATIYDFHQIRIFWTAAAAISLLLLGIIVLKTGKKKTTKN